jgi:hypothetical protein
VGREEERPASPASRRFCLVQDENETPSIRAARDGTNEPPRRNMTQESQPRKHSEKFCVRKGSLVADRHLTRQVTWGTWKERAKFGSQAAAERFVRRHVTG